MTNEERWVTFIVELRAYIGEHHYCTKKHTDLYNRTRNYRRKMKDGSLPPDKAEVLESVLSLSTNEHTGGRKNKSFNSAQESELTSR